MSDCQQGHGTPDPNFLKSSGTPGQSQSSEEAFAYGKPKVFDPQRAEAILKTTDVADNVNASVRGAGALSTVHSHWTRVSSFVSGVGR